MGARAPVAAVGEDTGHTCRRVLCGATNRRTSCPAGRSARAEPDTRRRLVLITTVVSHCFH